MEAEVNNECTNDRISIWIDELNKIKQNKEMGAFFSNVHDLQSFSAGYIMRVYEDNFIINHIHPDGYYDGFRAKKLETMIFIERKNQCIEKLNYLAKWYGVRHETIAPVYNDAFMDILHYAQCNQKVIVITLIESDGLDITGIIRDFDNKTINVLNIDEYGEEDGESLIYFKNIYQIDCDRTCARSIEKLWKSVK